MKLQIPPVLNKKGLFLFLILLFAFLMLMVVLLLSEYASDIFNKGFDYQIIAKLIILSTGNLLPTALAFPTIIAGTILYRKLSKDNQYLKFLFLKDMIVVALFSLFLWVFAAFIQPNINLHFVSLLYDMQHTAPGKKLEKSNLSLFKGKAMTENIGGIIAINDSLKHEIRNSKEHLKKYLKTNASPETLDSLFANNALSYIGFTKMDFENHTAKWNGYHYPVKYLERQIMMTKHEVNSIKQKLTMNMHKIWQMFFIPLSMLLLFMMSVQLGIIHSKTNIIKLLVFLMFLVVPIWYYSSIYVGKIIDKQLISIALGKLGLLCVLLLFNFGLYIVRKKQKLQSKEKTKLKSE